MTLLETPFFRMSSDVRVPAGMVSSVPLSSSSWKINPDTEVFVAQATAQRQQSGEEVWPNDDKPTRWRFVDSYMTGDILRLVVSPSVTYNQHRAANSIEFLERFGWEQLPNALAVTAVVETADNYLLVTQRLKADYRIGGLHFSMGGFISIETEPDGNPTKAVIRESCEEVGIRPDEISELTCFGIAWDKLYLKPDVLYHAKLSLTLEEVRGRKTDKENANHWLPISPTNLDKLFVGGAHATVPVGLAALLMVGKDRYGTGWYSDTVGFLQQSGKGYPDPERVAKLEKEFIARVPDLLKKICV